MTTMDISIVTSVASTLATVVTLVTYLEHRLNRVEDRLRGELSEMKADLKADFRHLEVRFDGLVRDLPAAQ